MEDKITAAKALITATLAAGTALWGWFGWMVVMWVICMVLDYVSGSIAAMRAGEWSSQKARDGLWHKAGMILAVAVAALADTLISLILNNIDGLHLPITYSVLLAPVVIAWYILTELGSIIENAAGLGARVPPWLKKFLKVTADAVDKAGQKAVGEDDHGNDC